MTLVAMDNVVTTLLQHKDHFMLKTLMPGLPKLNWQSNVGHVLDVALQALGLKRSKAGKELWTETAPEKLSYQETKATNSRQPKEQRQTVAGQLGDIDLSHDASAPAAGSRAAQAAAEAARPPAAPHPPPRQPHPPPCQPRPPPRQPRPLLPSSMMMMVMMVMTS